MVTKGQRVVVLKERRGDFRIHGKFSGNYTRQDIDSLFTVSFPCSLSPHLTLQLRVVTDSKSN